LKPIIENKDNSNYWSILALGSLCYWAREDHDSIRAFSKHHSCAGVIAHALSRQGKSWFEKRLGPNVEIQWFTYNAKHYDSYCDAGFGGSACDNLNLTYGRNIKSPPAEFCH